MALGRKPVSSSDLAEDLDQLLPLSSAEWGLMKSLVQLRNSLRHQRQLRFLQSFGTLPDVHVLRTLPEQLRTLGEELRTLEEQEQHEELAVRALKILVVRALKILAVRALLRNLAVRAQLVKHLSCERSSLPLIF